MAEGIETRHRRDCRSRAGGRCNCTPSYRAWVHDHRMNEGRGGKQRRTFPTRAAAKTWRQDMLVAVRRGEIAAQRSTLNLDGAVKEWLRDAAAGTARTRSRTTFAPSSITAVRQAWNRELKDPTSPKKRLRSLSDRLGRRRVDALTLLDVQDIVDELDAAGVNPSTIEAQVFPLRVVYRRLKTRGDVTIDPTDGLELPQKTSRGRRVPPAPADAAALLDALEERDRPLWACAMFAGLRRGELAALLWDDVDLDAGRISVTKSWTYAEREARGTKSVHGRRHVPITAALRAQLAEHALRQGRGRRGFVFGDAEDRPFDPKDAQERADDAWTAAGLTRVTLHAARHLYASMSIAAGVNAAALAKYMGHSSIAVTFDLYGHLFPGNEAEAAALLDDYLGRAFVAAEG